MAKTYLVAVGDRIFRECKDKLQAIETAELASKFYLNAECKLVHKNWNHIKGTPVFMNGEEVKAE